MSDRNFSSYSRPLLLLVALVIIGLLVVVLVRQPSGNEAPPAKKVSDLMAEIEELETTVLELEDTVISQQFAIADKDQLLVDKYLELELMIRWVKRLEAEGEVKSDSIVMLKERIDGLRRRVVAQRTDVDAEKLLNYEAMVVERDSLLTLLDSLQKLSGSDNGNQSTAALTTANYRFTNVRKNGREDVGSTFKRNTIQQINICFDIPENSMAQAGEQTLYLVIENPDGTIRNAASNPKVYKSGQDFPYTNLAVVNYTKATKEVCIPVLANKDEDYEEGIQYVYVWHNDKVIGRTHFEVD